MLKQLQFGLKVTACIIWAIPFTIGGLLCCVTIFLAPVGIALFGIAIWPFQKLLNHRIDEKLRLETLPHEDTETPWEV